MKYTGKIRGAIYLPIAKIYFVLISYVIYMALSRILGPEKFGIFGVIIGIVSVINMMILQAITQSVSKFISENDQKENSVKKSAFIVQIVLGGGIFLIFFLCSGFIAKLLNDETLTKYFRVGAFIILFYSFYGIFLGALNGKKNFFAQGTFDMMAVTLKLIFMVGLAYLGYAVWGALIGFVISTFFILLAGIFIIKIDFSASFFPIKRIINFVFTIMGFYLVINLIINVDLLSIKALTLKINANIYSGYYTAALTIARIPFMVLTSIGFIIFPLISKAVHSSNSEETKKYIIEGIRITLYIASVCGVLISASSGNTLLVLYKAEYLPAAPALQVLSLGYIFYALFLISTFIVTSSGKPLISLMFAVLTLGFQFIFNYLLVQKYGIVGASIASTASMFLGVVLIAFYIFRKFNAFINLLSLIRTGFVCILIYLAAYYIKAAYFYLILKDVLLGLLFFGLLFTLNEIKLTEIKEIKEVFKIKHNK